MSLVTLSQVNVFLPEKEQPLLRDLNFEIKAGEWVALVGTNGSGKSILAKLIAGLEMQYNGEILRSKEASPIQLVMQNPDSQLIGETVWEDVCFGLEVHGIPADLIGGKASMALGLVGLSGLEGRQVHTLSGGQKQLLAIAGAIVLNPSIIIADEVTSMLDPASRHSVLQVFRELKQQGVTILMITQLLEELAYADRLIALNGGTVYYQGGRDRFFYNGQNGGASICEEIGLETPYTVRVAKRLLDRGVQLQGYPIVPEELFEAVTFG